MTAGNKCWRLWRSQRRNEGVEELNNPTCEQHFASISETYNEFCSSRRVPAWAHKKCVCGRSSATDPAVRAHSALEPPSSNLHACTDACIAHTDKPQTGRLRRLIAGKGIKRAVDVHLTGLCSCLCIGKHAVYASDWAWTLPKLKRCPGSPAETQVDPVCHNFKQET